MKQDLIAIFITLFVATLTGSAATVVNYNPTNAVGLNRSPSIDNASQYTIAFNSTTPLFDGLGSGERFYGGFTSTATSGASLGATTLALTSTNLISQTAKLGDGVISSRLFMFYDVVDFIGHTQGKTYTFDQSVNSSFSSIANRTNNNGGAYIIRDGTNFYISNTSPGSLISNSNTQNGSELMWAAFTPANFGNFIQNSAGTNQSLNLGYTAASFTAQTFNNVTGVGFLACASRALTNNIIFTTSDFQASLIVVPEPSTIALVGIGALALSCFRHRK